MDQYENGQVKMHFAAIKIQSVFRGYIFRYYLSQKNLFTISAKKIQKAWRAHRDRQIIQRVIEILALFRLNRAFQIYRVKHSMKKKKEYLRQFDDLLGFYPVKSKDPVPKTPVKKKKKGKSKTPSFLKRNAPSSKTKDKGTTSRSSNTTPRKAGNYTGGVPRMSLGSKKSGRKKKIIIDLPAPWHNKNERRLSQSQKDDMLYNQKENLAWVKKEIIPLLFRRCNPLFSLRDDLRKRNELFKERIVTKSFLCPIVRSTKALSINIPRKISFVGPKNSNGSAPGGCTLVVASATGAVFLEPKTLTADNIISHSMFDIKSPLIDVEISPASGQIVGLDSNWNLLLFEHERIIFTYELATRIETKLPKVGKYLQFDKFGLLWVNLFPQKGPMLLFDTLTLQPSLYYNLENVATIHRFMRSNISMIPLYFKDKPYGFIGIFEPNYEIYLFSLDFQKFRKIINTAMKNVPIIKQANQRIYIWSNECYIYVYELREVFENTMKIATIQMPSPPIDLCATSDPDLVYIACEDHSVHVLLGKTTEHPLRLSTARMDPDEINFCDILLGPMYFTKSRNQFREISVYNFNWMPLKIAAAAFSDKLVLVSVFFEDSQVSSVWFVNDAQTCKCIEFDQFTYSKPEVSLMLASSNFNDHVVAVQRKRSEFLERLNFFNNCDKQANTGLMNNLFNPTNAKFPFAKYFLSIDMKKVFSFIPDHSSKTISLYLIYHYMMRIGQLPIEISTFAGFLEKFAPPDVKIVLPPNEMVINPRFPVKTTGLYSAMVPLTFDFQQINDLLDLVDPYKCLQDDVGKYSVSRVMESFEKTKSSSTPKAWISDYEKKNLLQRHLNLTMLEDLVKTELMNRIQSKIDVAFQKHQLNKMQPVHPIDISRPAPKSANSHIEFSTQANRNPLLDENRHQCIYDKWSKHTSYARESTFQLYLRTFNVSSKIMSHSSVQNHFDLVRRVAHACTNVASYVHSFSNSATDETLSTMVVTEDVKALPLSHYLTIHSYLGGNARLISAVKSIFSKVLVTLYQLHKAGIIVRTIYPANILLNSADLSVKIGSIYDCQQTVVNGRSIHLPLPEDFAKYTNPFLPPEFYHEPPRRYTTAFDIWQFGMTLLYVITGYLPPSYGSELKQHLSPSVLANIKKHVRIELGNELNDPPIYPKVILFYDWLKGAPLSTENDRQVGDRGECFFTTTQPSKKQASILDLDKYKLLPYKNTKVHYDEATVFIEIISSCLQIDPAKRPTVEQLLCTYPFNQMAQVTEIFDSYMKTPDPNIFVSQFFSPILNNLDTNNFQFAIGIISSLLFYEDMFPDDMPYSFPLDTRANDRVIESLFQLNFVDRIVAFVLDIITKEVSRYNVHPTITYENACFNSLHRFFQRFVSSVERGTGALLGHVDEVIMSLLSLYTASPHLRHNSSALKSSPAELFDFTAYDSVPVYVFTYNKLHSLIRYALEASPFIMNSLIRTEEHNDSYFSHFISFSEAVHSFCLSLLSTIEKQKVNIIKTLAGIWQNGEQTWIVRQFLDFKVPQKIIHCFYSSAVRNEACSFICSAFRAIKLKSFEPTYIILQNALCVPTIILHCANAIKQTSGSEALKVPAIEMIRAILFGESASAIISLVVNDVIWSLAEMSNDMTYYNLMTDAISFSSVFVIQIIMSSQYVQQSLARNGIEIIPRIDFRDLAEPFNLVDTIMIGKRLAAALFIRQSPLPPDIEKQTPPVEPSCDFLVKAITLTLKECNRLAKSIDNQVLAVSRFDLKGSTILKARDKVKEEKYSAALANITEICDVMQHLFRCLCFYWRHDNFQLSNSLFIFIKTTLVEPVPLCNSISHPASKVHQALQKMILYCIENMPNDSPVLPLLRDLIDIWAKVVHRDIMFAMSCVDKDITQQQMLERYPVEREIRIEMLKNMITSQLYGNFGDIFKILINEMLYNKTEFKFDSTIKMNLTYRFPLRSEAISVILFVIEFRDKYESAAKQLAIELITTNVVDKERKLTESDDNHYIVNSAILLLRAITQCHGLFDELLIKNARTLLESLCMRFSREMMNEDVFSQAKKIEQLKKPLQNLSTKEMWQKPLTALPKTSNAITSTKSSRNNRPQSAFSTKRSVTLSKPTTPR